MPPVRPATSVSAIDQILARSLPLVPKPIVRRVPDRMRERHAVGDGPGKQRGNPIGHELFVVGVAREADQRCGANVRIRIRSSALEQGVIRMRAAGSDQCRGTDLRIRMLDQVTEHVSDVGA